MILNYIYISVLISFPETMVMLLLGFYLSNIKTINISRFVIVSLIQTLIAFFVMISDINLVIHTLIQIVSLYLLVLIVFDIKAYKYIVPVLIGSFLQGLMQSIVLPIIGPIWGIQIGLLYNNIQNAILCFIPILIISVLVLIVVKKNNFYLYDINN